MNRQWLQAAAALLLFLTSPALMAELLINEIDYDQPATDSAEFVEIKNVGGAAVDLSTYTLVFVNGTGGGASVYNSIALPSVSLAPGDYFVVCGNAANTPNCDLDVTPDQNLIQNGAPDAVALTMGGGIVDTVSYEGNSGTPYTEGSGVGLEDGPALADYGISRIPDGNDTDQNNVDFFYTAITPGAPNSDVSTTTALSSDPNPSTYGQNVNFTATVTAAVGTPTGTVAFQDNGSDISGCSAQALDGGGQATCATTALDVPGSPHPITAVYSGDATYATSTSSTLDQVVNKADQIITFDAPPSVAVGTTGTLSATGGGSANPVVFSSTTPTVCTTSGTNGSTVTGVTAGQCDISAAQAGDDNYNTGSNSESFTIEKGTDTTVITDHTPDPSAEGKTITVSYSVTPPGATTPTGTVMVSDGIDTCSASVAAGQCTLTLNTSGTRTLVAHYQGDANYNASDSAGVDHSVLPTTVTGANPVGAGDIQVSIVGDGNSCGFTSWQFEAPVNPPARFSFPYGLFRFAVGPCTPGSTLTLTFTYPGPLGNLTVFGKYGPTPSNPTEHWYALPATANGNQLVVQIPDGGKGDSDLTVDGFFSDPGGAANMAITSNIPTLPAWAMGLLAALLGAIGWRRARVRQGG